MRSYDIFDFADTSFTVRLAVPLTADKLLVNSMVQIEEWCDLHCEDEYIILLYSVLFKLETDALIFKLKYGF